MHRRTALGSLACAAATLPGVAAADAALGIAVPHLPRGGLVLFQGDSITDGGRQREGHDLNHIYGQSYPYLVMARCTASYPALDWRFENRGVGGNTVIDLDERWEADTLALKPDVLSILVGINETTGVALGGSKPVPVPEYERRYDALLKRTRAALPAVKLVLCEPFTLPVGQVMKNWPAFRADVDQRRAVVARLAKRHGAVHVPLQEAFDKATARAPAPYWIWDGIHQTPAGQQTIADAWLAAVNAAR